LVFGMSTYWMFEKGNVVGIVTALARLKVSWNPSSSALNY